MRVAGVLEILSGCLLALGCGDAPADDPDDGANVEDITAANVEALAVIAPPEVRVLTAPPTTLLGPKLEAGRRVAAIRTMKLSGKPARLVVDIDSLVTSVVADDAALASARVAAAADDVASAPYPKSLATLAASSAAIDSVASTAPTTGIDEPFALTIDMCQSRKTFERRLFDWAATLSDQIHRPVPVGIAMSGGWAKVHGPELDAILDFERRGKITITWINHSSTHPLHCLNASCSNAEFLTASSVDFDEEVLGLERALLGRSLVPSAIFRFPGLVHDPARMHQLARLSLMAIDGDAWIAKGQPIKPRAVVLVHGNGNEPEGITGFLRQVQTPARSSALRSGKSALVSPLLIAPTSPR